MLSRSVLPRHGDFRIVAGRHEVPETVFQPHEDYANANVMITSSLSNMANTRYDWGLFDPRGTYSTAVTFPAGREPDISANIDAASTPQATGDYDDPMPDVFPGPFANKPNEGSTIRPGAPKSIPYYSSITQTTANGADIADQSDGGTFYSPNRIMTSPGMFGSLPPPASCPGSRGKLCSSAPQSGHPGENSPPDHLLAGSFLDASRRAYAISDRFSTDGKINLNYQIIALYLSHPFDRAARPLHKRKGHGHAEYRSLRYKGWRAPAVPLRNEIDAAHDAVAISSEVYAGDVFKSASEICSVHVVPVGQTAASMPTYWQNNALTGDNVRELSFTPTCIPDNLQIQYVLRSIFMANPLKKLPGSSTANLVRGTGCRHWRIPRLNHH